MPADCDLLVIAGPVAPFTDSEVEILRQYLEKNGRLFVLVHPRVPPGKLGGLDSLLADYNVDVRDDEIVIEPDRDLMGRNGAFFDGGRGRVRPSPDHLTTSPR